MDKTCAGMWLLEADSSVVCTVGSVIKLPSEFCSAVLASLTPFAIVECVTGTGEATAASISRSCDGVALPFVTGEPGVSTDGAITLPGDNGAEGRLVEL